MRQRLAEIEQDIFAREHQTPQALAALQKAEIATLSEQADYVGGSVGAAIVTTARASGIAPCAAEAVPDQQCRRPAGLQADARSAQVI